jgi:hypothetical protein
VKTACLFRLQNLFCLQDLIPIVASLLEGSICGKDRSLAKNVGWREEVSEVLPPKVSCGRFPKRGSFPLTLWGFPLRAHYPSIPCFSSPVHVAHLLTKPAIRSCAHQRSKTSDVYRRKVGNPEGGRF